MDKLCGRRAGRGARFIMLAAGGILTAMTVVLPQIGLLEWITLIPAALAILGIMADENTKLRQAYGYGLFFFRFVSL